MRTRTGRTIVLQVEGFRTESCNAVKVSVLRAAKLKPSLNALVYVSCILALNFPSGFASSWNLQAMGHLADQLLALLDEPETIHLVPGWQCFSA